MALGLIDVVILLLCALGVYLASRRDPRLHYYLKKLGGPPSYPLVGSAHSFIRPLTEYIPLVSSWQRKYGQVFSVWVGNFIPYVFCGEAELLEKILSTTAHIDKGKHEYELLHNWLGLGLLTAPRRIWHSRRKMLTPSFHFKILEDFIPIFNEQASIFLNCIARDERDGETSAEFDLEPYISKFTLDVICESAMGKKMNVQMSNVNKKYFDAVNGLLIVLIDKNFRPWLRIPVIYKLTGMEKQEADYLRTLKEFTERVFEAKKAERQAQKQVETDRFVSSELDMNLKKRRAFLDFLLDCAEEDRDAITDAEILDEVNTFMFEGHDTTGVNLAWTILMLGIHGDCQRKLHEELDKVFADDPERDITLADISKMKYLECCVKETLRLFPSVPFIFRQVDYDIKLDSGKVIPEGATACIPIYLVHRSPEYFKDPLRFNPERFSAENSERRHPYVYIPFSAGPRNCIGQKFALLEEKLFLVKLFRKYHVQTRESLETLVVMPNVIIRSKNGVNITLRKRKQTC